MDIPPDFRSASIDHSLKNMVRVAPWATAIAFLLWGLFRILPDGILDPLIREYYVLGMKIFLAWCLLAWWAGHRALRTGQFKALTLNSAHGLFLIQSAYMTVVSNLADPSLYDIAVALFVLPCIFYMSPRRYRIGVIFLMAAIAIPLYLMDHSTERILSTMSQAIGLAILSSLLQSHVFQARLEIYRYTESLRESNEQLARTASLDHLTQLENRRSFDERFQHEWQRSLRHGNVFTLVSVDLDFFKKINDTLGHAFGDQVLKEIGELLRHLARHTDTVARMGGEEFMVLLVESDSAGGAVFAHRILQAVPGIPATRSYGRITASIGLASSQECDDPDQLLQLVDRRLYRAKHEGRDRVVSED